MARCGCGGACACSLVAGDNITLLGSGAAANPWIISSHADPAEVRAALTSGQGTVYNPADGSFDVCLDPAPDNAIQMTGAGGCLYVQPGAATVTTGAGVLGNGSPGDPVRANVDPSWPYPCDLDASASSIYVDPSGRLRAEPLVQTAFADNAKSTTPGIAQPFPAGPDAVIDTLTITLTNPDNCRPALVILQREADVLLNLPPNTGADVGIDTDDMVYRFNNGDTTLTGVHTQISRFGNQTLTPGEVRIVTCNVTGGRGDGSSWSQINMNLRAWIISSV